MSFYTDFRFPSCCSNLQLPGDGSTGGFHVQSLQARWECSKSTDQCDATALQHLQGAWEVMGWNLWKLENLDKRIKKENFHGCKFQCKINAWNRTWNTWNGPCFFSVHWNFTTVTASVHRRRIAKICLKCDLELWMLSWYIWKPLLSWNFDVLFFKSTQSTQFSRSHPPKDVVFCARSVRAGGVRCWPEPRTQKQSIKIARLFAERDQRTTKNPEVAFFRSQMTLSGNQRLVRKDAGRRWKGQKMQNKGIQKKELVKKQCLSRQHFWTWVSWTWNSMIASTLRSQEDMRTLNDVMRAAKHPKGRGSRGGKNGKGWNSQEGKEAQKVFLQLPLGVVGSR